VGYPVAPDALTAKLRAVLALPPDERAAIGQTLRANVRATHSLDALMPRLVRVLGR
jgi:hypothetical protein